MNTREHDDTTVSEPGLRTGRRMVITLTIVWLACVVAGYAMPRNIQVFDFVEKWVADLRVAALTPSMPRRSDIIILSITEETLRLFPYRSPIDRGFLASILAHLDTVEVKAIGMDILLDQPTEPKKDQELAAVISKMSVPVIIGLAGKREGLTDSQAAFLNSYVPETIKAHINLVKDDSDGTVRWIYPGQEIDGEFRAGFASALAKEGGITPPTDRRRLLYRKATDGSVVPFPTFPIHLTKSLPKQWFAGKYILIGADLATEDRHRTPYATLLGDYDGSVSGVVIHALALSQILDRATSRDGGIPLEFATIAITSALGVLLAYVSLALFVKFSLAMIFIIGMWITGFGIYQWGGPIVPLFIPSVVFIVAAGVGNAVASQRFRMEKELAETAVRARSEFLAMMSHEIRTPMNGVLGVIELLKGSGLNKEQNQMAGIVQDSAKSLLGILNDILDFSKIEAGRVDINPETISLKRVLNGVIGTFSSAADSKGISLELDFDESVPDWIMADPVRVRQILTNLVGNAIKFTKNGSVVVSCRVYDGENEARLLLFRVEDDGIGMSPEALKKLFTPFTQADELTTRRFGGTGLGLTISLQLAELMEGRIEVESEQDKGSIFSVYLPLIEADAPADGAEMELPEMIFAPVIDSVDMEETDTGPVGGPLVLVAEDNPTNQWLIRKQLAKLGYRTDVKANGRLALESYRSGAYDLVLTDIHMPEMDGFGLTRAIRGDEENSNKHIPILALTANILPEYIDRCHDAGMNDVLLKPTELATLGPILKKYIGAEKENGTTPDTQTNAPVSSPSSDCETTAEGKTYNGETVLDMAMFLEIFGEINDNVRSALASYVKGASVLVSTIENQMNKRDCEGLAKAAHGLAGESLSAGAMALGRLCKDLETAAMENNWDTVNSLGPKVAGEFKLVREAISDL